MARPPAQDCHRRSGPAGSSIGRRRCRLRRHTQPPIKTFTPVSANQITNIDVLRQQIRNYYGDPLGTGVSPADSNYAKEASRSRRAGQRWLDCPAPHHGTKAIVLDVDDTTLLTWNYEIVQQLGVQPDDERRVRHRPEVPGGVRHGRPWCNAAEREGYAIFFLTGRPATQEEATLGNLTADGIGVDAGYPKPTTLSDGEDGLFTKPAGGRLPGLPEGGVRERPERLLHDDPLQVGDARAHRVARLRHRGELRRPVQRPRRRLRRRKLQDAEPELLPAVIA